MSAKESLALEDSSVIVLHCNDVGDNICILAIEGYGVVDTEDDPAKSDDSATFRGPRTWRDAVGGATLCCSRCCATLGFASLASPETFRFLKHRLSVDNDEQWESLYTCCSFVAREMVRYAESKAIYTFVVAIQSEGMAKEHRKCLLLKLVSWDTRRAISRESSAYERNSQVDLLDFRKVLKVIYEVADDRNTMTLDGGDPMNWTWGGVDLCCLPGAARRQESQSDVDVSSTHTRAASVRLWLSPEDWGDLLQSLVASSKSFSKVVTEATMIVKLGLPTKKRDDNTTGLSALPLL
jgi:HECT-like Ubiquitin-conjugating enzyme (E2)-binding